MRVQAGQTWWDVGIELSGAWEAGIDLALQGDYSMTDTPPEGLEVKVNKSYNLPMERYCKAEGVSPATLEDATGIRWRIFSEEFNTVYK